MKPAVQSELLFELHDIFGIPVRTTKKYWKYIRTIKHADLKFTPKHLKETLQSPEEVFQSIQSSY